MRGYLKLAILFICLTLLLTGCWWPLIKLPVDPPKPVEAPSTSEPDHPKADTPPPAQPPEQKPTWDAPPSVSLNWPKRPITPVQVTGPPGENLDPIQVFLDDVASNNAARITRGCWTNSPAYRADFYLTEQARGLILAAATKGLEGGQTGLYATVGDLLVGWSWIELESIYACPLIFDTQSRDETRLREVHWTIHRAAMRAAGTPVHESDIEAKNPLYCGDDAGDYRRSPDGPSFDRPASMENPKPMEAAATRLDGHPLKKLPFDGQPIPMKRADGVGPTLVLYEMVNGRVCLGDVWD